jgi:hypothetical protein
VSARLVAALGEPGCPVCRCLEADARQDLAAYLREQTMDPAGRAALRRSGGFCGWHVGLLRDSADGILSVALLAEDLVRSAPPVRVECAACAALQDRQARYLAALRDPAPALREALDAGPGLPCRPHLRAAGAGESLVRARLARLAAALAGFIAKQDYRSGEPPSPEEARAWGDALEHLAGRPTLFGSDLARDYSTPA